MLTSIFIFNETFKFSFPTHISHAMLIILLDYDYIIFIFVYVLPLETNA
jgi:hypothetical protein